MDEDFRIELRGSASNDRSACDGKNPGGARGKSCRLYAPSGGQLEAGTGLTSRGIPETQNGILADHRA